MQKKKILKLYLGVNKFMFLNLFKNRPRYVDVEPDAGGWGGKRNKILILIIIAAIFILAFWNFDSDDKTQKNNISENESHPLIDEYIEENEKRLEEILTAVQGAGRVKVMISVVEMSEKVIATDKKTETKQDVKNDSSVRNSLQENTTVIYGTGSEEKPFVVKEKLPVPSGVVVTATGAGDESVRLELYEAVKALYGLSGHRIKITKGNINNK